MTSIRVGLMLILISNLAPIFGLKCYVCSRRENPTFTIDASPSFRIVDNLPRDRCRRLEEVLCDRDHDVCFTMIQYKIDETGRPPRSFSISKGCYKSSKLGFIPKGADKTKQCHQQKVHIKEDARIDGQPVKDKRVQFFEAMKHTCVCNTNRCNGSSGRYRIEGIIETFGALPILIYLLRRIFLGHAI